MPTIFITEYLSKKFLKNIDNKKIKSGIYDLQKMKSVFIAVQGNSSHQNFFCAFIAQFSSSETTKFFGISKKQLDYHI